MYVGETEMERTGRGCMVVPLRFALRPDKQPEVIISGVLFFGSFLLDEQKEPRKILI
jgi:hypothetical protein